MGSLQQYANEWEESSKYHYDNGDYNWMEANIHSYQRVLEIGCGTGYSTKALLSCGHEVITIDNNPFCIEKTKELLNGFQNFTILEGDITDSTFFESLLKLDFDIIICWNLGGEYSDDQNKKYLRMSVPLYQELYDQKIQEGYSQEEAVDELKYHKDEIYRKLITNIACKLAKDKNIPINIVVRVRGFVSQHEWSKIKKDNGFSNIQIHDTYTKAISNSGRELSINGEPLNEEIVDISLYSITLE